MPIHYQRALCIKRILISNRYYLVLHMNWGMINGEFNGYYNYDNWYFGDVELNYDRKMITNIVP